ncbi:MAG: ATP-binding cassette domain-containing protein, partial [Tepidimonas taiwanensis]|nr:ATP-binding cassette domain-containing protein [Tepidimonas taiwanensis]
MELSVTQVGVRYPGAAQAAVEGVTLGLRTGDIGVLIGPSGCGKTSLLRAVAGLERIDDGRITLDGHVVAAAGLHVP